MRVTSGTQNNAKGNVKNNAENNVSYYLPPGKYRVSATYGENLKMVKTVTVNAGETVVNDNFNFNPGVADFTATDSRSKQLINTALDWLLERQSGEGGSAYVRIKRIKTSHAVFALQPGHYRMTAEHGKHGKLVKEFDIVSGKVTKDTLALSSTPQTPRWEWK